MSGKSGSASFHAAKKSSQAFRLFAVSPAITAARAEMREREQRREWRVASVIENLLKLGGCFRAPVEFQVDESAQVLQPELGGRLVARCGLQLFYRLRRPIA